MDSRPQYIINAVNDLFQLARAIEEKTGEVREEGEQISLIKHEQELASIFFNLGVEMEGEIYLGSRHSQEFKKNMRKFPYNVFNPEMLGLTTEKNEGR